MPRNSLMLMDSYEAQGSVMKLIGSTKAISPLISFLLLCLPGMSVAQMPPVAPSSQSSGPAVFGDSDAMAVLDNLQQAMESLNGKKFLSAFDAGKMQNYSAFRAEITNLFRRYDSFTVTYHLIQSAMEGQRGVVLTDFGVEGAATSDEEPNLRRQTQLRLELEWTGKQWKIVELTPRSVFE